MQELGAGPAVPPQAADGPRRSPLRRLDPEWPWWLERAVNQPAWTSVFQALETRPQGWERGGFGAYLIQRKLRYRK